MKKILILSTVLLVTLLCSAQTNLQLNQVLTYNGNLNQSQQIGPTWTVPTGKVWKIESRTPDFLKINGSYYTGASGNGTNGIIGNYSSISLPIWLKSGDSIRYEGGGAIGSNGFEYFISILEFNLTQ